MITLKTNLPTADRQLLPDCPQVQALLNLGGEKGNEEEGISLIRTRLLFEGKFLPNAKAG